VLAGPHPDLRHYLEIEMLETFGRHQSAIGHAAGELRLLLAEQNTAHGGMDAIGADQHVSAHADAVVELDVDGSAAIAKSGEAMAAMHTLGRNGGGQHRQHIGTMALMMREAECADHILAERRAQQRSPIVPPTLIPRDGPHAHTGEFIGETVAVQNARSVRADLDAGTDLAQGDRLLIDVDVEAGLQQRERGGEPADTAAGNGV
jgi:hypothetical protein